MNALEAIKQVTTVEGTDLYSLRSIVEVSRQINPKVSYKSVRARLASRFDLTKLDKDTGILAQDVVYTFFFTLDKKEHAAFFKSLYPLENGQATTCYVKRSKDAQAHEAVSNEQLEQQAAKFFNPVFARYQELNAQGGDVAERVNKGLKIDVVESEIFSRNKPAFIRDAHRIILSPDTFARGAKLGAFEAVGLNSAFFDCVSDVWDVSFLRYIADRQKMQCSKKNWAYALDELRGCSKIRASALPEYMHGLVKIADENSNEAKKRIEPLLREALAIAEIAPLDIYSDLSFDELMDKCDNFYQKTLAARLGDVVSSDMLRGCIDQRIAAYAYQMRFSYLEQPENYKAVLSNVEAVDGVTVEQQQDACDTVEQQAASYFAKDNTQGRAMVDATQPAYFRYYGPKDERRSPVQYAIEDAQIEQCGAVTNLYLACSLDLGKSAIYTADFIFNDDLYLALFAEHDWFYNLKNCTHLHASALPEFYLSVIRFARAYMSDDITTDENQLATLLAEALAISELAPLDTYNGYSLDELMTKCENHYQKTVEAKLGKVANPDELRTSIDIKVAAYLDELTKDFKAAA